MKQYRLIIKEIWYMQKPLKNMINSYDQLGMVFHFVVIIQLDCDLLYPNLKFKKKEKQKI